ncbi:coproporphyrinogen-III oxidase family protein [Gordonia amicalis]|uniref:Heme chaperone HemW n=1 Tax=Gordonia amicalis TaxID=89053 RepID=A0AAE4R006_9ACTN|nr:coproporphyrinogen-III oxidase family protein [Gordonia amicalis]MDV6310734.1 coproporphyrinogen-III oxidase family protein [Gordonia amicalis]
MYSHPLYHWPPKSSWTRQYDPESNRWSDLGVYLHYPFCRSICDFCNYETRLVDAPSMRKYGSSVLNELADYASESQSSGRAMVDTVFFGGGTASLMPPDELMTIIQEISSLYELRTDAEITLECEPGSISESRLAAAVRAGVNRIGVCAQAFDDDTLTRISRRHTSNDSIALAQMARDAGVENLHLDLMYGLPGQSLKDWENTLLAAMELPFTHVSIYKLYVHKNGLLHRSGTSRPSSEDSADHTNYLRAMHDLGLAVLSDFGYAQYTLTEYAKPGYECRYLLRTFSGGDVLPVGPSSFGRRGRQLWHNAGFVHEYLAKEGRGHRRAAVQISRAEALKRDVILGLWLLKVDISRLERLHGVQASTRLLGVLNALEKGGLLEVSSSEVSVNAYQRFGVGEAMRQLAELDAADWVEHGGAESVNDVRAVAQSATTALDEGVVSVLRVARRDPEFFRRLSASPDEALRGLPIDRNEMLKSLIVVIQSRASTKPGASLSRFSESSDIEAMLFDAWDEVAREHRLREQ